MGADCRGQRRRRAGQARICKRFARLATGKTEQQPAFGQRLQLDPGAQHEHLQTLQGSGFEVTRHDQPESIRLAPDDKAGLHASLGGAPCGMLHLIDAQMVDVAGKLVMQERPGIIAGNLDKAKVGERHQNGLIAGCLKLADGIAEVENLVGSGGEDSLRGFQKTAPVRVHEGSCWGLRYYIARSIVLVPPGHDPVAVREFPCVHSSSSSCS